MLTSPETYRMDPESAWQRLKTRVRKPKELAVLIEVAAWREREAQSRDVPRSRVLKDEVIADIAVQAPTTIERLKNLRSLPKGFERSRWGEAIVAAVGARAGARSEDIAAARRARQPAANGAAVVELLKVLLRMISERHHVAAKVIATVDDLERIAADDDADVPALRAGGANCSARRRSRSSTASLRSPSRKARSRRSSAGNWTRLRPVKLSPIGSAACRSASC